MIQFGSGRSPQLPFSAARRAGHRVKFAFGTFALALAALTATSRGYVLEGQSWPTGSVVVLQLSLGNPILPLQDGSASYNDAVAPAANMWSSSVQRVQVTTNNSGGSATSGDHVNSVVFATSIFGQAWGANTLAVTYYRYSGSTMMEADILFNQAKIFNSYRGPLQFPGPGPAIIDIRRVFLHELGHGLGLNHPDSGGQQVVAVMNSLMSNQEVLSADDLAGAHVLYGAPSGTPTPTPTPNPTPPAGSPSHLANISTRMKIGIGDNVLIGGFMITGTQSKKLILRAMGPSLSALGVANAISDPVLQLFGSSGAVIASNDDWSTGTQVSEIQASGLAPSDPYESALIVTLSPGNYTAIVSGYNGEQGVGLVEAYEFDANTTRMVNISTRGRVGTGDEAMIGGMIVQGAAGKRVIIRAIGPSLGTGPNPIANVLADPTLELRDGNGGLLAANDDWNTSPQAGEIIATTVPPTNNRESAIVATLGAGNYTAIVRGVNQTSGVGLVEAYDLDP
jgi:matrixin